MGAERLDPAVAYHVANSLGWPSLRPLQEQAVIPVLDGSDCLLVAPTAGGKTEAALLPLLSAMTAERWQRLSVLYVCPLKALLNNLEPRLAAMTGWLGRRCAVWHGDVSDGVKRRLAADPPDLLLTTPESLEGMLLSARVDHGWLFADLRCVVVDEVHAFAAGDRGWHLLGVLHRLERLAGRRIQRIGLSATVGNPAEVLSWLAGGSDAPRTVVSPPAGAVVSAEVGLDHVRTLAGAARVIAALHQGEKRLVFAESRASVEYLARALRSYDVRTFVSHSSVSPDERRQAEAAFAAESDCVIVATSTLELGIDVGDLDRVIQVDAPRSVASFLQRMGRTGRRPGTSRNTLVLATSDRTLLAAAAVLLLWSRGAVEAVTPPLLPRHIVAQQALGVLLQERRLARADLAAWLGVLTGAVPDSAAILDHLISEGWVAEEGGVVWTGPSTERRFGRRNFLELTSAFTAAPLLTALHGRVEVGHIDPLVLSSRQPPGPSQPRVLLLGGRDWQVRHVDWRRRQVHVEPTSRPGRALWSSGGAAVPSAFAQAMREVLAGADPPVTIFRRAREGLADLRAEHPFAREGGTVLVRSGTDVTWWTFGGSAANEALATGLPRLVDAPAAGGLSLPVRDGVSVADLSRALTERRQTLVDSLPAVDDDALDGLKFSATLPRNLARDTLARRLADPAGVARVIDAPVVGWG